ncbi:MAG: DegV family protein [Chloroflexi bacterium]|nr:DegV family protein [Chloroflexota bacterium]
MVPEVAIVTDTTACIPGDKVAEYAIEVVPVQLVIDGKAYRDGIDLTATDFYKLLKQTKKLPTTAASSPEPYLEAYRKAGLRAKNILCITVPSRFSTLYNSARLARDMFLAKSPGLLVEVIDCPTAAAGMGLVALAAARAAAAGKGPGETVEMVRELMPRVYLYAALDTLKYLAKSGRVPQAAAMVNSVLDIKPVFTLNGTGAHTVALPRTMAGAIKRMLGLMAEKASREKPLHAAVMHADALDQALRLKKDITSLNYDVADIFITEFTPVMGAHTGPGLVGVAFYSSL